MGRGVVLAVPKAGYGVRGTGYGIRGIGHWALQCPWALVMRRAAPA